MTRDDIVERILAIIIIILIVGLIGIGIAKLEDINIHIYRKGVGSCQNSAEKDNNQNKLFPL